jgi:long-chain acyl-CoA synthetase
MNLPTLDTQTRPWMSLYPGGIQPDATSQVPDLLSMWDQAVAARGATECLRYFDASLSMDVIDRHSDGVAGWLADAGIGRGDRVVLLLQNTPHFLIGLLAAWKRGAIPVPCNPMYRSAELAELFTDCTPGALICHDDLASTARDALSIAGISCAMMAADPSDWQQSDDARVLPASIVPRPAGYADFKHLAEGSGRTDRVPLAGEDIGLLLYTSGTTGKPKGAAISHASMAFNSAACGQWMGVGPETRVLALAPLFHVTGLILHLGVAIHAGCPIALFYRFHPALAIEVIRSFRPTFTVAAITAFNALMASGLANRDDFACFETVYSGGAPIAPALRDQIKAALGIKLLPAYGMTESCSPTHLGPPGVHVPVDPETGALAVGIPIPSTDVRICAASGEPLPVGEAGEVWMRGPQIMAGYWNMPAETSAALSDGWLRSGDVGVMNAQGWLFIVDRQKDMISASGFKVWPRQVEDVLLCHPDVREAAVIGEADAYRGETVHAFVSVKQGAEGVSPNLLIDFCRERLAAYKVPRRVTLVEELPKTATGKIQRAELRRQLQSTGKGP